jgi:3-methyl-2-oxobutanoate hydroxymethyltransferase
MITQRLTIPVIGIGAGDATNGQVLVYHDLLGYGEESGHRARFVRQYARTHDTLVDAVRRWAHDVRDGSYPSHAEGYGMAPDALEQVRRALAGVQPD